MAVYQSDSCGRLRRSHGFAAMTGLALAVCAVGITQAAAEPQAARDSDLHVQVRLRSP